MKMLEGIAVLFLITSLNCRLPFSKQWNNFFLLKWKRNSANSEIIFSIMLIVMGEKERKYSTKLMERSN